MASLLHYFGRDVTLYLLLIVAISTLGPLQFGFHLVRRGPAGLALRTLPRTIT